MTSLSLCMIVRDEAWILDECLAAARRGVDEIVVVDTGSVDDTRRIAGRYADRLLDFTWCEDFAAARNVSLAAAGGEWILVLDADERIAEADYPRLREAMAAPERDGYYLPQYNYGNDPLAWGWRPVTDQGADAGGFEGYTVNPILRLFRRCEDIRYEGRIHEIVDGTIKPQRRGSLEVPLHHYIDANPDRPRRARSRRYLAILEAEIARGVADGRLLAIAAASAMHDEQDYRKAGDFFLRAAAAGHEPDRNREGAAEAAYRGGEFGVAVDRYRQLYDEGIRTPTLCLNLANLTVRHGDRAFALELLRECLRLGGISPRVDSVIEQNIGHLAG